MINKISSDNCTLKSIIIIYWDGGSWNYFLKKQVDKTENQ